MTSELSMSPLASVTGRGDSASIAAGDSSDFSGSEFAALYSSLNNSAESPRSAISAGYAATRLRHEQSSGKILPLALPMDSARMTAVAQEEEGTSALRMPFPSLPTETATSITRPISAREQLEIPAAVAKSLPSTEQVSRVVSELAVSYAKPASVQTNEVTLGLHSIVNHATPLGLESTATTSLAPNPAQPTAFGSITLAEAPLPVQHARFGESFAHEVAVLARDGVQQARISLHPAELGPVELRILVRNDEASVQFAAQHGAARDALEDALPRLREQFEQAGLRLGDSSVHQELPHEPNDDEPFAPAATGPALDADSAVDVAESAPEPRGSRGLIDAYV